MPICPVTKKCEFTVAYLLQNTHFSPAILRPFGSGRQNFNNEIKVRPTCARKILSRSVKANQSYSRKADFEKNTYYEYNKRS